MADTYCILERSAASSVTLSADGRGVSMDLSPQPVKVPCTSGPPGVLDSAVYERTLTFTGVRLSASDYLTLVATAIDNIVYNDTYPQLKVYDQGTATATELKVTVYLSGWRFLSLAELEGDVTCVLRSTSGYYTFVVDSGGANATTVYLDRLEQVSQILQLAGKGSTLTGADPLSVVAEPPMEATVSGWVATTGLNTLQKVLDAATAVEMVGAAFDTTGSGYFSTELTSTTTAILESMSVDEKRGSLCHVTLGIVRDTTP